MHPSALSYILVHSHDPSVLSCIPVHFHAHVLVPRLEEVSGPETSSTNLNFDVGPSDTH